MTAPRRQAALLASGLVVVITAGLAAADVSPSTPWRHLYLVPVVLAGLRFGAYFFEIGLRNVTDLLDPV